MEKGEGFDGWSESHEKFGDPSFYITVTVQISYLNKLSKIPFILNKIKLSYKETTLNYSKIKFICYLWKMSKITR